jgi:hypothetical protein
MIYMWFTGINYYILTFEKIVTLFLRLLWPYGNQALLIVINQQQRGHFLGHPVYAGNLVEKHQWIFYNNKRLYINEWSKLMNNTLCLSASGVSAL